MAAFQLRKGAMVQTKQVFLASSAELREDRDALEIQISRLNTHWVPQGVQLQVVRWEHFLDVMTRDGLQQSYNDTARGCDLFVMLFWTKVGEYTREEFEAAFQQFKVTQRPFILTYFKDVPISPGDIKIEDLQSLQAFQQRLKQLGHYQTRYTSIEGLWLHFEQQLERLVATGFVRFDPAGETASAAHQAKLTGSGAIAQGPGAIAVGARGVMVQGSQSGNINTGSIDTGGGAYIGGNVVTGGDLVGRDKSSRGSWSDEH